MAGCFDLPDRDFDQPLGPIGGSIAKTQSNKKITTFHLLTFADLMSVVLKGL